MNTDDAEAVSLARQEAMILDWLAKPYFSEVTRLALEESLRRVREAKRALALKQFQTPEQI